MCVRGEQGHKVIDEGWGVTVTVRVEHANKRGGCVHLKQGGGRVVYLAVI